MLCECGATVKAITKAHQKTLKHQIYELKRTVKQLTQRSGQCGQCEQSDCVICFEELSKPMVSIMKTPCGHTYHTKCLDKWLVAHKTCPICRFKIDYEPERPPPQPVRQQPVRRVRIQRRPNPPQQPRPLQRRSYLPDLPRFVRERYHQYIHA